MIERIVVGLDGSQNAQLALRWALDLARVVSAEVVAVHAVGLLEASERGKGEHDRDVLRARFESEWCRDLDTVEVPTQRLMVDGDPVLVLLRTAEEVGADLVVVGSRGLGDRPELMLGSTSTQVTQRSTKPVVVVPPDCAW